METQKTQWDYKKELQTIENFQNIVWFRPDTGKYSVELLTEPEFGKPFVDKQTKEENAQIQLRVLVKGQEFLWGVGQGKTLSSIYGQLMQLGCKRGKLIGEKFTLLVKKDKANKREYTILELLEEVKVGP